MAVEQVVTLLKAVTGLLGVLIWPTVVLFILVRFGPSLRDFFGSLGELTFKAAGIEATAKRRQVDAAVALGAAVAMSPNAASETPAQAVSRARDVAEMVAERVNARTVRLTKGRRVLWVDDRPLNNVFERRSLEALGIEFDTSTSTEDALTCLAKHAYAAVISDMGRPPDKQAGYTLLDAMRARGDRTPFVIYAGSNMLEHREMARTRGAIGSTNRADELFQLVLAAVGADGKSISR